MNKEEMEKEVIEIVDQVFRAYKKQGKRVTRNNIKNLHMTLFSAILHVETKWLRQINWKTFQQ